jgi:hypothetical protein
MSTSRLQDLFVRKVRYVFEPLGYDVIENFRPKWLKTKSSQRALEIDVFIPELHVGVEIHGKQHFEHVPFFHQTDEDFERAIRLDMEKRIACAENGVFLFEIETEERVNDVIEKICKLVEHNPFDIKNSKKYKVRKRAQIEHGQLIAIAKYKDDNICIYRHRDMKNANEWHRKNNSKVKLWLLKLSKAPHGEDVYFRNLIERGMGDKAIETFMDYGQPIHKFSG